MDPNAQRIIDASEARWDANKGDCNRFARGVAADVGITIVNGNADAIIEALRLGAAWSQASDGAGAKAKADNGQFVIAGLKSDEHTPPRENGHVAVVVSGPLAHDRYPTGYWGSLGGTPYKNKTLNYSWNSSDRDNVEYFYRILP